MKLKRLNTKVCVWLPYQVDVYWLMRNPKYNKIGNSVCKTKWFEAFTSMTFDKIFYKKEWGESSRKYRCSVRYDEPSDSTLKLQGGCVCETKTTK